MSQEESGARRENAVRAVQICESAICDLIREGFGERTIVLKAANHRVTLAEVVATKRHKLT